MVRAITLEDGSATALDACQSLTVIQRPAVRPQLSRLRELSD